MKPIGREPCPWCATGAVHAQHACHAAYQRGIAEGHRLENNAHAESIFRLRNEGIREERAHILKLLRVDWHREGTPEDYIEQHSTNHIASGAHDAGAEGVK